MPSPSASPPGIPPGFPESSSSPPAVPAPCSNVQPARQIARPTKTLIMVKRVDGGYHRAVTMYRLTPTRRDLLRWSGFGAARLLIGCGDNEPVRDPGTQLATAIVEPDSESFLVSVWAGLARSVALEVQSRDVVISRTSVDVNDASQAVFSVEGLEAATSYDVSVTTDTGARILHQV